MLIYLLHESTDAVRVTVDGTAGPERSGACTVVHEQFVTIPFYLTLLTPIATTVVATDIETVPTIVEPKVRIYNRLRACDYSTTQPIIRSIDPNAYKLGIEGVTGYPVRTPGTLVVVGYEAEALTVTAVRNQLLGTPPGVRNVVPPKPGEVNEATVNHRSPTEIVPGVYECCSPVLTLSQIYHVRNNLPVGSPYYSSTVPGPT